MKIFVGYDHRQPVAFHVAAQSILNHASKPVAILPLVLPTLPINRQGLTPFTYSRFLVPWLCGYSGKAVFMDSDFMARADLCDMPIETGHAVCVSKNVRRFEWASLMVFDCEKCQKLTPEYVQTADNKSLFGMTWAESIGSIPGEWNHLVGYDAPNPDAKLVHFTQGLPCFPQTVKDEHGEEWRRTAKQCVSSASWESLMGNSVHAPHVAGRNKEAA